MKKILTGILVLFVAIFGFAGLSFSHAVVSAQIDPANQYINEAFNSKATNFRLQLNDLLKEHTVLSATMLAALYKREDTSRLEQLMADNENLLASQIQNVYGNSAHDTFIQLWSAHMDEYKNYTIARKNNDSNGMNTARNNLKNISTSLGNLLEGPNLSASTVSGLMMDHVNGTLSFVDAVATNDLTQKANLMKQGYDQAGKFADTLVKGIILDKPGMF